MHRPAPPMAAAHHLIQKQHITLPRWPPASFLLGLLLPIYFLTSFLLPSSHDLKQYQSLTELKVLELKLLEKRG